MSKLSKLRGRTFAEIASRGRQKAASIAERIGASRDSKMPSDGELFRLFGEGEQANARDLLERYRTREKAFFPSVKDREGTLSSLRSCFPGEEESIVRQAEQILSGRFDLLGHIGLDFGSPIPDWRLDPLSGKKSPARHWSTIDEIDPEQTGDKKVIWELNRHQYFLILGRAYWLTEDELYTKVVLSHVEDWIENNPPKTGLNWMSSLEIAYRSISWIWAFHFFCDSPGFRPDTFLKILKCLYLNARHIEKHLSIYSSPNTHLTGEALGLYAIGTFLREIGEAARWKETGYRILMDALDFQIRNDGGYVEQSTQYNRYTADIYLSLYILRKAEGLTIDRRHEEKLRKTLEFLMNVTQPNGETPLIGDDDGGRLHFPENRGFADFRSTLTVGAAMLADGRFKSVAGEAAPELLWLTGREGLRACELLEPISVTENVKEFSESGWYIVRDGWEPESNFALIDCGEHGFLNGGHAHADALSFVMSVKGQPVVIDPGTYTYTADKKARDRFRSSSMHNCLTVNGQSSSIPAGPFSWKTTAVSKVLEWAADDAAISLRATHDGYDRFGILYEREFKFVSNVLVTLTDKIETASRNDFEICFTLAPEVETVIVDRSRVVLRRTAGKSELLTIITKVIEEKIEEFQGWRIEPTQISPRYGSLVDSTRLVFALDRDRGFHVENSFLRPGAV